MNKIFLNELSKMIFGLTVEQAHDMMVCIDCKKDIEQFLIDEKDRNEYNISGLCSVCFDKHTKEKE